MTMAPFVRPYGSGPDPSLLGRIGWVRPFTLANFLFALGCGLLVPEIVAHLAFGSAVLDLLHWIAFFLMLLWAWPVLLLSIGAFLETPDDVPVLHRVSALLLAAGSVGGFALGLFTLTVLYPGSVSLYIPYSAGQLLIASGYFVYIPTVFAPILAGHAGLALLVSRSALVGSARERFVAGAVVLLAVAGLALFVQFAVALGGWEICVVGLGLPGYYLVASAAQEESRRRSTAVPWIRRSGFS